MTAAPAVDELLQEIFDPKRCLSDLLRQALVVSNRIDLPEFRDWIELELNGYKGYPLNKLPAYRIAPCRLFGADSPAGPWIAMQPDDRFSFLLKFPVAQGVSKLEEALANMGPKGCMQNQLPSDLATLLRPICGFSYFMHQCWKPELAGVIPDIRSELVRRTSMLDVAGGGRSGRSFLKKETTMSTGNTVNFYGPATANVQQGNTNAYQVVGGVDADSLRRFLADVRSAQKGLGLTQDQNRELSAELATVEAQLASPKPKSSVVSECLKTIRNLLEGVTSNGLAAALLPALPALIHAVGG